MRIDWQIYYDAAKKCHDLAADLRRADKPVHDTVKGECAGMAGDAPGCKEWGEVSKYQVTIPTSVRNNGIGIKHHGGVQELFDALIAQILKQFGKLPNGDIAKLAKASSTWTTFANHQTVTGAAAQITTIIGLFDSIDDKPNLPPILGHLETLRNGATQVAAASQNLAVPVAEYHTGTVDVRRNFESSITQAVWAIGLTVVAAAAAAFFTFGSSAAAGAGGVGIIKSFDKVPDLTAAGIDDGRGGMNREIIEYEDRWLLWPLRDSRGTHIEWGSDEFELLMDSGFRIVAGYGTELSPRFYGGFPDRHVITHWSKTEVERILAAPVKATAFFKTGCVRLGFGNGWVMLTSEHCPDVPFAVYSGGHLLWRRPGLVEQTKYPVIQVDRWTGNRITAPPWPSRPDDLNINYDSDDIND